eukprot:8613394-Pyramimonas_sp.AAC.1
MLESGGCIEREYSESLRSQAYSGVLGKPQVTGSRPHYVSRLKAGPFSPDPPSFLPRPPW